MIHETSASMPSANKYLSSNQGNTLVSELGHKKSRAKAFASVGPSGASTMSVAKMKIKL